MTRFHNVKGHLIGGEDEDVSWLFYFIVSSAVSGVIGLIVTLIGWFSLILIK